MLKQTNDITGNDLGFGIKPTVNNQRMINPDGTEISDYEKLKVSGNTRFSDPFSSLISKLFH